MKLVTPAKGTIELSKEKDPELFYLARCGLGGLGVVAEVTLRCVERHQLVEHTFVSEKPSGLLLGLIMMSQ
jgi:L-galactono-1,4-lactone dehydrogenase